MRIAALLTCFNRCEKTRACLTSLYKVVVSIDVYLVDDGSTDSTSAMVSTEFPQVHLLHGDGNLFWSRGMYTAWCEALKGDYDYYLWLNDDIILYPDFLDELLECNKLGGECCLISGLVSEIGTGKVLYGGTIKDHTRRPADGQIHEIYRMNGNVVLVPKSVVEKIGIMDPVLHHGGGDNDYGYTAQENGIKVYGTRKYVAEGYSNPTDHLRKWGTNISNRFKFLYSPMGACPSITFYFDKKHFGLLYAVCDWIYLHIMNIPPDSLMKILFRRHYSHLEIKPDEK